MQIRSCLSVCLYSCGLGIESLFSTCTPPIIAYISKESSGEAFSGTISKIWVLMEKGKVYTNFKSELQLMLIMEILHFSHTSAHPIIFKTKHGNAEIPKIWLFYVIYGLTRAGSIRNLMRIPSLVLFSALYFMFLEVYTQFRELFQKQMNLSLFQKQVLNVLIVVFFKFYKNSKKCIPESKLFPGL